MANVSRTMLVQATIDTELVKFTANVSSNIETKLDEDITAAKTGQLTTRTDNTTGTLTMAGGHGITTGARLDIFWTGGARYGVTVGTVATNSVPFSLGSGDNLPANLTNITAMVPTPNSVTITGDNVKMICGKAKGRTTGLPASNALLVFTQSDDTFIAACRMTGTDYVWYDSTGIFVGTGANPLAGASVGKIYVSHADSSQAVQIKGWVLRT